MSKEVVYTGIFFLVSSGFVYWASISWNNALSDTFSNYFSGSEKGKYLYALFVTFISILVIGFMAYLFGQKAFKM